MSRTTDFEDAVAEMMVAVGKAWDGNGFHMAYVNAALEKAKFIESELGLGDNPSADPFVLVDPLV